MDNRKARRALAKARGAAQALTRGKEILTCVEGHLNLLIEGAEEGVPPVSKIGRILFDKFGADVQHLPVRQWIGTLTRALLTLEGFEVDQAGVRFTDPVFKSGSTYRRVKENEVSNSDLEQTFGRLVEGLTTHEQQILHKVLQAELGSA